MRTLHARCSLLDVSLDSSSGALLQKAVHVRQSLLESASPTMECSGTIIFLHIPRTGGTTFQKIPPRNYRGEETLIFDGARHREQVEQFANLPESQRAKYNFISGHLYYGFHRFLPER